MDTGEATKARGHVIPQDRVAALAVTLGRVDAAHRRLRTRIAHQVGLTVTDLTALLVISDAAQATPKYLAAELGLTSGSVTTLLDRLADAGQVRREPKPGDRRSLVVALTLDGTVLVERVWQKYLAAVTSAVEASPQLVEDELLTSLQGTVDAIDAAI